MNKTLKIKLNWILFIKPLLKVVYSLFFFYPIGCSFSNWRINLCREKNNEWSTEQCLNLNPTPLLKELSFESHLPSPVSKSYSFLYCWCHVIPPLITLPFSHSAPAHLSFLLFIHPIKLFLPRSFWSLCSFCNVFSTLSYLFII